jgi:hypothetical protein
VVDEIATAGGEAIFVNTAMMIEAQIYKYLREDRCAGQERGQYRHETIYADYVRVPRSGMVLPRFR